MGLVQTKLLKVVTRLDKLDRLDFEKFSEHPPPSQYRQAVGHDPITGASTRNFPCLVGGRSGR